MKYASALDQQLLALRAFGIGYAAVNRADHSTGLLVEKTHALRALITHYVEEIRRQGGVLDAVLFVLNVSLVNSRVRALGLTGRAVDTIVGYYRGHGAADLR